MLPNQNSHVNSGSVLHASKSPLLTAVENVSTFAPNPGFRYGGGQGERLRNRFFSFFVAGDW